MTIAVNEPCPKFLAEVAVLETMGLITVEDKFHPRTHWVVYDYSYETQVCGYCHESREPILTDDAAAEELRKVVFAKCVQ